MSDTPLLQYALSTDPNPVQISDGGHSSSATMTVVASNPMPIAVTVQSIAFQFSEGANANNLTTQSPSAFQTSAPAGWSSTSNQSTVVFTPDTGAASVGPDGLTFVFVIQINDQVGTTPITVTETGVDPDDPGTVTLEVSKFPLNFTVEPLTATPQVLTGPGKPTSLNWAVYGGDAADDGTQYGCVLSYSTAVDSGSTPVGETGPYAVDTLSESTLYTLTVSGTDTFGNQFSNDSSVYVVVGPPLVTDFTALDGTRDIAVDVGQQAMLAWTTQNATAVVLTPNSGNSYTITDPLNTGPDGYGVCVDEDTSFTLAAVYQDDSVPTSAIYAYPVNVTINPPVVETLEIGNNADANYVNASYHLSFTTTNANYVCLTISADQGIDPAWYPADAGTIDIVTPLTNGVEYSLTAYRLDANDIAIIESETNATASFATCEDDTSPESEANTVTLNFVSSGVYFEQHSFPSNAQNYTFDPGRTISGHIATINGFYFYFADGDNHHISSLGAYINTETTTSDSVFINVHQLLADDSNHYLDKSAYVKVQLIYTDDTSPKALAFHGHTTTSPTVMNVPEVTSAVTGLYKFD